MSLIGLEALFLKGLSPLLSLGDIGSHPVIKVARSILNIDIDITEHSAGQGSTVHNSLVHNSSLQCIAVKCSEVQYL